MSNKEILEKVIQVAIDNGWNGEVLGGWSSISDFDYKKGTLQVTCESFYDGYDSFTIEHLIFNHDFAKSLWGEKYVCARDGSDVNQIEAKDTPWRVSCDYENGDYSFAVENFKYHLQQMVIADDPIKYLGESI